MAIALELVKSWIEFKFFVDDGIQWVVYTSTDVYELYGVHGPLLYRCTIMRDGGADVVDFEANYKDEPTKQNPITNNQSIQVHNEVTQPISVVFVPAVTPSGGTKVSQIAYGSISSDIDSTYLIPNGETLVIQSLTAGCELKGQGSAVELWYDPNGDGSAMTLIDAVHVSGTSDQHSIYASYVGDGTKKIRIRRRIYGGGSREVFARWEGYY